MWKQLPLLPTKLNILIIRPAVGKGNHQLHRQFHKRFTVRCSAIEVWLCFLKNNHPTYADIEIVEQRLTSLPTNNSILDQLHHVNKSAINPPSNFTPHPHNSAVAEPLEHNFNDKFRIALCQTFYLMPVN